MSQDRPHEFKPQWNYGQMNENSCTRCGLPKTHPVHAVPVVKPPA